MLNEAQAKICIKLGLDCDFSHRKAEVGFRGELTSTTYLFGDLCFLDENLDEWAECRIRPDVQQAVDISDDGVLEQLHKAGFRFRHLGYSTDGAQAFAIVRFIEE